jgi:pyruvate kinase
MFPRTKIVATLGPATRTPEAVRALVDVGVSCFRINFAHGDPGFWRELVDIVRDVEAATGRHVGLMGDLAGPSVRVGGMPKSFKVSPGERLTLRYAEAVDDPEARVVPVPVRQFFDALEEGDEVVADDGRLRLRILSVKGYEAEAEALTESVVSPRKALVIRGKDVNLPAITSRDIDALKFAVDSGFDIVSLSYVRSRDDVKTLHELLKLEGSDALVASKIETVQAVRDLRKIVQESDVVVVARGDLGMNFRLEEVPFLQEEIVSTARSLGKPVVLATQVLESMMESPVPTRAEVNDVATAVRQGVDAIMLTGETAVGRHPVEAVKWLRRVIQRAESMYRPQRVPEATTSYAWSIVDVAEKNGACCILAYSMRGTLPPQLAAARPGPRVIVGVPSARLARRFSVYWGIETWVVPAKSYDEGLRRLEEEACARGELSPGDVIVSSYTVGFESLLFIKRIYRCPPSGASARGSG